MSGDVLLDRRIRLTIQIPVATPGDFTHVTTDDLVIGGADVSASAGHRITFKISKSNEKSPNTIEVTVFNLNENTRHLLQKKGVKLILECGYKTTGISRYAFCDVRTVDHIYEKPDWKTILKGADGERSFRYAFASQSFAPGTGGGEVLKYLANQSGLELGNVPSKAADVLFTFDQGYVVHGLVNREMDRLVHGFGWKWSIQDGALQVLAPGESVTSLIPLLSAETGLIGSPEMGTPEKKGKAALVKFKALLFVTRPGNKVHLKSDRYNGQVTIKKVEFVGDTHGNEWYAECQGVIDGA